MTPVLGLALSLAGCPRPPPPVVLPAPPPAPEAPERAELVGPTYWSEPGGLCLEVPAGWSGSSGEGPLLLELATSGPDAHARPPRPDEGFRLEVRAYPLGDPPAERPGMELLFEDHGTYRDVPVLGTATGTRSWVSVDADGPMAKSWFGPVGGRTLELVTIYPLGQATEGEAVLAPVLASFCTTWRQGSG